MERGRGYMGVERGEGAHGCRKGEGRVGYIFGVENGLSVLYYIVLLFYSNYENIIYLWNLPSLENSRHS